MMQVKSHSRAGVIRPIVSSPGRPDPVAWSRLTVDMIVTAAPSATPERVLKIAALRRSLARVLTEGFRGLRGTDDPHEAASHMHSLVDGVVRQTEWGPYFGMAEIRTAIADTLFRNVTSLIEILEQ